VRGNVAIVKSNYVKKGKGEREVAKANIRYMEHRRGRDGQKMNRTLFSVQGAIGRHEAYRMIDTAGKGSYFYRLVLSPDPVIEDIKQDLYLREITMSMFSQLEERLNTPLAWVAAIHNDHTAIRHVHMLAVVPTRLSRQDCQALIQTTTEAALSQRRQRDLALEQKEKAQQAKAREEEAWEREA
jgi:hypothetical protein